ncbi:unnamed protein product [Nippostrongylus brasiliensis]|uniref:Sushi domain-containing protein n=1 Tax=Nippostrongylus brasiliensis TaxID=27835 RepID=A0A0N4Y7W4_NIPBR|nr:unnamed protein product [Nippostrongylus brasiliensis]
MPNPVCDNCAPAVELTCPKENLCDFTKLKRTQNAAHCSTYSCASGQMIAYLGLESTAVAGAVCDRDDQLKWKTPGGETYGETLQATCAYREWQYP